MQLFLTVSLIALVQVASAAHAVRMRRLLSGHGLASSKPRVATVVAVRKQKKGYTRVARLRGGTGFSGSAGYPFKKRGGFPC